MDDAAIYSTVAELLQIPKERVVPGSQLRELVPDSFALVEMVIDLQDLYAVTFNQTDFSAVHTAEDLARLLARRVAQRERPDDEALSA